jgi:hypothetical protein
VGGCSSPPIWDPSCQSRSRILEVRKGKTNLDTGSDTDTWSFTGKRGSINDEETCSGEEERRAHRWRCKDDARRRVKSVIS